MKFLFLSIFFLHLLITTLTKDEYEFGDIIEFPRKKCGITYKHFALYVDDEYPGKGDIIHRTGNKKSKENDRSNDIGYGNLEAEGPNNKMKLPKDSPELNKEEIKKRIELVLNHPTDYSLRHNNCEHFATYLRFGVGVSNQDGTVARHAIKRCRNNLIGEEMKKHEDIERSDCSGPSNAVAG